MTERSPSPDRPSTRNRGGKKEVIEEDEYVARIDKIIKRDFFPELAHERLRLRYLLAHTHNELDEMRQIEEEYYALQRKEGFDQNLPTLDSFHSTHVSEDNHSYEEISERDTLAHRKKLQWMYALEEAEKAPKALPAPDPVAQLEGSRSDAQQALVVAPSEPTTSSFAPQKGWKYKAENALMFYPAGIAPTELDQADRGPPKALVHANTRFDSEENNTSSQRQTPSSTPRRGGMDDETNTPLMFRRDRTKNTKVDLDRLHDDTYAKMRASPARGNYDYLSTPVLQPGTAGESSAPGASFSTWGTLQSTPQILSGCTSFTPSYQMPPTPRREQLAKQLTDEAAKNQRAKKAKTKSVASKNIEYRRTKTPLTPQRMATFSPAARHLLSSPHSPLRGSASPFGGQLTRSYAAPSSKLTPRASSKRYLTPSRTPRKQTAHKSSPLPSPAISSGASITDNLLNL